MKEDKLFRTFFKVKEEKVIKLIDPVMFVKFNGLIRVRICLESCEE